MADDKQDDKSPAPAARPAPRPRAPARAGAAAGPRVRAPARPAPAAAAAEDVAAGATASAPRRTLTEFRSLRAVAAQPAEGVQRVAKRDEKGRSYGTGRRKNAISRVWVMPGTGKITVNGRESTVYFARPVLRMMIGQPLIVSQRSTEIDVWCTVVGGGLSGQAGAVRHGISRALCNFEPALRSVLKSSGFLTRDSRVVERKKYGKHKARRSTQFSKR